MKALNIINAPESFAMFLVAMNITFRFSLGEYIIEDADNANKFIYFCARHGVRAQDIAKMEISEIEL